MKDTTAPIVKIVVICAVMIFAAVGYIGVGGTLSYYNDVEASAGNLLTSSLLDLIAPGQDPPQEVSCTGAAALFSATTTFEEGSVAVRYRVGVEESTSTPNDANFCNALRLKASLDGTELYDGSLLGFMLTDLTATGTWQFAISLPPNTTSIQDGVVCDVRAVFMGWQEEVPSPVESGWDDVEQFPMRTLAQTSACQESAPCPPPPCDTCAGSTTIIIENNNTATVTNEVTSNANTGGNSAHGGEGGGDGGSIKTGNASSSVTITQSINQNNITVVTSSNSSSSVSVTHISGTTSPSSTPQDIKDKVNETIRNALSGISH